jgi:hypothetical protein
VSGVTNRNRKLFYTRPGESSGFTLPMPSGASRDVQEETDHEYISEQLRQGRKRKIQQEQMMQDRRYYYGQPAPRLAPAHLAALQGALEFFDAPIAKEIEGTGRGVRAKLFNHCDCVFHCGAAFRRVDKEQFLSHVASHEEIRDYVDFVERARRDYESLKMRREELEGQAAKVRNRLRSAIAIARNLRSEEKALVRRLAEQGAIDQHSMNMLAGGESDDDFVVVKENDELRNIRKQALAAEDRERKESSQLERNLVERRAVDRQIQRFKQSPDTQDIAAGKAGDYDVVARLLQDVNDYDVDPTRSAGLKKATYLPGFNRFVESTGGAKY